MEQQLQQLQQLQQQQQQLQQLQQPQHFVPIQAERAISPGGGVMLRHAVKNVTNAIKANAVLGISIPTPVTRNVVLKASTASNAANTAAVANTDASLTAATTAATTVSATKASDSASASSTNPLTSMVQDVVLSMILNIPALRTKLQSILDNPSLIGAEISKVYDELQTKLTRRELEQLNLYVCQDSSRRTIGSVMQTAFSNIMADGKIDMNDAPHFLTLVHESITLFSADATNGNSVPLNSNTVITFLHFVLKCILILTLDEPEETEALVMLDCSFKLVKLSVVPLLASKKWCCFS